MGNYIPALCRSITYFCPNFSAEYFNLCYKKCWIVLTAYKVWVSIQEQVFMYRVDLNSFKAYFGGDKTVDE